MLGELQGIGVERNGELDRSIRTRSVHLDVELLQVHADEIRDFLECVLERGRGAVDAEPLAQPVDEGGQLALNRARPDDAEGGVRGVRRLIAP